MEHKKIAQWVVTEVKKTLLEKKKQSKHSTFSVEIEVYNKGTYKEPLFQIVIATKKSKPIDKFIFNMVGGELDKQFKALKETKGWDSLSWSNTTIWENNFNNFPQFITLFSKPCKEFTSLVNYMSKYCGKDLKLKDIFSVRIGGKRGRIYGEEDNRYYLAYQPKRCQSLLNQLRECRGSKDIVHTSEIKYNDDIDPWELECSIRNEVEFSGVRNYQCEVSIYTPSRKLKKVIPIRM